MSSCVSLMNNFHKRSANFEYTTHEILELSRSFRMGIVDDFIYHFILVLDNHATLFHEEIFRQNRKQNLLKI